MTKTALIPDTDKKRIIIAGGGFAGLKLARKLSGKGYQIVLIDRHNYHQFQPLFYQVATAGLEPSSISFPLRKIFQKKPNVHFRMANLKRVNPKRKTIETNIGVMAYDYLVLALGAVTNFFGMESIKHNTIPMKSVSEAIYLRNYILMIFERALNESNQKDIDPLLNFVLVGGGPTGVELAGALAEMKKFVLPKDYPELDFTKMQIYILEASQKLLGGMSEKSSETAIRYLKRLGVNVKLNSQVTAYTDGELQIKDGKSLKSETVIWTAGISGEPVKGLSENLYGKGKRIKTDRYSRIPEHPDIYAIGDMALMVSEKYPKGHPQVAQVAIQQGRNLAENFINLTKDKKLKPFEYKDKGTLATVGRKLAIADLPGIKLQGFIAWIIWLVVHLMQLVGIKNRFFVFINWMWNYVLYDQSLRVLIRPKLFRYQEKIVE